MVTFSVTILGYMRLNQFVIPSPRQYCESIVDKAKRSRWSHQDGGVLCPALSSYGRTGF